MQRLQEIVLSADYISAGPCFIIQGRHHQSLYMLNDDLCTIDGFRSITYTLRLPDRYEEDRQYRTNNN